MMTRKRRRLWILLACGIGLGYVSLTGGDDSATASATRAVTVTRGTVASTVSASGSVGSARSRTLTFATSGTVSAIYVQAGDKVSKGKLLARLDQTSAEENVRSAKASLAASEAGSGGRDNPALLADAGEAVIAALYLDGGLEAARRFVEPAWRPLVAEEISPPQDAKTALQAWAQGQGLALPKYTVVSRKGPDHAPSFTAEVIITGRAPAQGECASKRIAEQAAATALLTREGEGGRLGDI